MYKNILFVEDEQFIAEMYADVLTQDGMKIQIEGDGKKGYELAATGDFDLILLDLMLPNMTGLEILRRLRDDTLSPNFSRSNHVVILTNLDEDDITKKKIFELAEGYYMKVDITPRKLSEIIKDMAAGKTTPPVPS